MLRIGQGYDLHRLVPDRELHLGGIRIPVTDGLGLLGHSDADVLLHAIVDAVIGSMAAGDIGQWFPDTDERYLNCSSAELLKTVLRDNRFSQWHLINLDCTIIAQTPKLAPHIPAIRSTLAQLFGTEMRFISVKAKTNEGVDAVGARQAIAAYATLLADA